MADRDREPAGGGLRIDLDDVLQHSYADYHVKGFDYLCLLRSPSFTLKAYFFQGDVESAPEVVVPHDHRYAFSTRVLTGQLRNRCYAPCRANAINAKPYEAFDYLTVLNGGAGFEWRESVWLQQLNDHGFSAGDRYWLHADDVHTIQVAAHDTILLLGQERDVVPVGTPTTAYRPDGAREAPSLSGLYREMDADLALARIELLRGLCPTLFEARA